MDSDSEDENEPLTETWSGVAVGSDATNTAWLPELLERPPGLNFPITVPEELTPVDVFSQFITDTVVENIVEETNQYAAPNLETMGDKFPQSRMRSWRGVTVQGVLVFSILLLGMGTFQQCEMTDHWTDHGLFTAPGFAQVMSRNRFQLLVSCVHFVDNTTVERGDNGSSLDALFKIRKFIDAVITNFCTKYTPSRCVAIDEQMVANKGRLSFKQYLPAKPTKWG